MPAVFDPDFDSDFPNIDGRPVARFAFTVHALAMDAAGTIAGELFDRGAREAGLDTGERVIEIDEGPPVGQLR
jgi:hypothetical protein